MTTMRSESRVATLVLWLRSLGDGLPRRRISRGTAGRIIESHCASGAQHLAQVRRLFLDPLANRLGQATEGFHRYGQPPAGAIVSPGSRHPPVDEHDR